jgi:flavin reductase (DIM6/NTAB) family NADH-FMN oxidoreductase RutF
VKGDAFERLLATLDHPLVVVSAASRRGVGACLVSFWSPCSVDPPRCCVYVPGDDPAHEVVRRATHVMVHFLERRRHDLAGALDPTDASQWRTGPDGRTPRLRDVDAWFLGRVVGRHESGDHTGVVLEAVRSRAPRRWRPLYASDWRS